MVKRKLHGDRAVYESSAGPGIRKSDATAHNMRPAPSETGSYSRKVGSWARLNILSACCRFHVPVFLTKVLHCLNNCDALLTLFSGKYCYKVVL